MDLAGRPLDGEFLFEEAACGLVITDTNGKILRTNPLFCRWLGYEVEQLVGKRIQDLLTIGCRVFHQTHWAPLLQMQGSVAEVKLDAVHSSGRVIPMLFNAARKARGAEVLDHIAVMVVTDRVKYEAELLRARTKAESAQALLAQTDRQKDEFLATLGHELRNPLAPMRNVVEILKRRNLNDPQLSWSRDVLDRQVTLLSHLVDDLLEISRVSQGKIALRKQLLDLAKPIRAAIETVDPLVQAAAQRLSVSITQSPIPIDADAVRITQVLQNILTNASKYTPDGGEIWITAGIDGEDAFISIRDTGIGIPADQLERVFNMFSQLEPALKRSQGGLGIGLALVRALVLLHGGSVSVKSDGTGHGSEFTVRLPISRDTSVEMVEPSSLPAGKTVSRRVLIVDDNVDSAETLSELLGLSGHQTTVVHNGSDALKAAGDIVPDAVMLDIGLPGMNGYEVAAKIRQEPWGTQMLLIAVTGWGQPQDKRAAADAGFDHHMTKPFDIEALDVLLRAGASPRGG